MKKHIRTTPHALATIHPTMCKDTIRVELEQQDAGPIPFVHVYHDQSRNLDHCSFVRLDTGTYLENRKGKRLGAYKDAFIKIMESKWEGCFLVCVNELDANGNPTGVKKYMNPTGYQGAVAVWLDTYPNCYGALQFSADGLPIMPSFAELL